MPPYLSTPSPTSDTWSGMGSSVKRSSGWAGCTRISVTWNGHGEPGLASAGKPRRDVTDYASRCRTSHDVLGPNAGTTAPYNCPAADANAFRETDTAFSRKQVQ